jgi:DNA repair exonuclease SbcCD nuclease subunit
MIFPCGEIMSGITWIHLSDWHQKGPDFDRQVVRDALIKDLRERTSIDPILEQVDFVVFSGDLAYNGESNEYETARRELLDPVLEVVGIKPETEQKADRLFIVPGNHDLSRECIYDMLPLQLQKTLISDEIVQKWLTDEKKRARVLEPFEAYREFVSGYTTQESPDYASILRLKAGNRQIALL